MFCDSCSKLSTLYTNKKCMKCQGSIYINISIICDICSNENQCCSVCLKKTFKNFNSPIYRNKGKGCHTCGK